MKWLLPSLVLFTIAGSGGWYFRDHLTAQSTAVAAQQPAQGANASGSKPGGGDRKPAVVVVAPVTAKNFPILFEVSGTFEAMASIVVKPRLDSQIAAVNVAEGAHVDAGTLLFTLDSRTIDAQIAQQDAQIAKDKAQLELAKTELDRAELMITKKIMTAASKDQAATAVKVAAAQLELSQAQRQVMEVTLGYARISAPISGRIGGISAKPGASVKSGDQLTTLNQIDPIYVRFMIPQALIADVRAAMKAGSAGVEVAGPGGITEGKIAFMDNTVDATGSILLKAAVPNATENFWPGELAEVKLLLGEQKNAILVPSGAVLMGQSGAFVMVIDALKAKIRPVKTGRSVGDQTEIVSGLAAGEQIAIDGQSGLANDADVRVLDKSAKPEKPAKASEKADGAQKPAGNG